MTTALTSETALNDIDKATNKYDAAYGRLFARLILASPAGLDQEDAGVVMMPLLNRLSESNKLIGTSEALALWREEAFGNLTVQAKMDEIESRTLAAAQHHESVLVETINAFRVSPEVHTSLMNGIYNFKEAAKRVGYCELTYEYLKQHKK